MLHHFAPLTRARKWYRAPAGFSGAVVWRGDTETSPPIALKAWPTGTLAERVQRVHTWMKQAAHLPFLPMVFTGISGLSTFVESECVWDCCLWQPGTHSDSPSPTEVEAACEAVAKLHGVWAAESRRGACPGISNRLRILAENEPLLSAGRVALPSVSPELDPLLRRVLTEVVRLAPMLRSALRLGSQTECALHLCVRDLRAEHILFKAEKVTGMIDFGATGIDSPAVDLARLLVDWPDSVCATVLAAYRKFCPNFDVPDDLVRLLAASGAVCSALNWVARLTGQFRPASDLSAVIFRLSRLLHRIEQLPRR